MLPQRNTVDEAEGISFLIRIPFDDGDLPVRFRRIQTDPNRTELFAPAPFAETRWETRPPRVAVRPEKSTRASVARPVSNRGLIQSPDASHPTRGAAERSAHHASQ